MQIEKKKYISEIRFDDFSLEEYYNFLRLKQLPSYEVDLDELGKEVFRINNEFLHLVDDKTKARKDKIEWKFNKSLFDYQQFIVKLAFLKKKFAVFAECGTGKTAVGLDWIEQVRKVIDKDKKVLWISPLNIIDQTIDEQEKFYNKREFVNLHEVDFDKWLESDKQLGIVNYDKFREEISFKNRIDCIILDESDILKSESGKIKTNIIKAARGINYKLCLTATPAPNDREEYANHALFLDWIRNYQEFFHRYFINKDAKWVLKPHATDAFYRFLASFSIFLRDPKEYGFEDNLKTVPVPIIKKVSIPLTKEQQEQAKRLNNKSGFGFSVKVGGIKDRTKFSQISKGFLYLDGNKKIKRIKSNKPNVILDLVKKHKGEKCIIWTNYDEETEILYNLISEYNSSCERVTGKTKQEKRLLVEKQFKNGDIDIMIANSNIFAKGMNFQICTMMAFSGLDDCYDSQTEILTYDGWKYFQNLTKKDIVATINPKNNAFEWEKPLKIINKKYNGEMHHYSGNGFDLLVTPNHKMYVQQCPERYKESNGDWNLIYSYYLNDKIKRMKYRMLSCANNWEGIQPEFIEIPISTEMRYGESVLSIGKIPIENFVKFIGWYLSEGSITYDYSSVINYLNRKDPFTGKIVISQSFIHQENRNEIIDIIKSFGVKYNDKTKDINFSNKEFAFFLRENFGRGSKEKFIPRWFKELDKKYLRIFLDTICKGDGCWDKERKRFNGYVSFSDRLLDDLQEICIKIGVQSYINKKNHYLGISFIKQRPYIYEKPKSVNYDGDIGCVRTNNGILVVRRNGKAIVSGNSYIKLHHGIKRAARYGATKQLTVYIPVTKYEEVILQNVLRKKNQFNYDATYQENLYKKHLIDELKIYANKDSIVDIKKEKRKRIVKTGKNWTLVRNDNIEELEDLEENRFDLAVFSPPFASLFTYSSDIADQGNSGSDEEFIFNYKFFAERLFKVMKPGRKVCVHVSQLPILKSVTGYSGIKDFRGLVFSAMSSVGFENTSEVVVIPEDKKKNAEKIIVPLYGEIAIKKNQQMQSIVKHAPGLAMHLVETDGCKCMPCFNDYVLIFTKPGENEIPVTSVRRGEMSRDDWITYASGCWMVKEEKCDIRESDILRTKNAKAEEDVKHLCLAKGSLVLTKRGYIPIEDVIAGEDEALTHKGRWRKVIAKQKTKQNANVVKINAIGVPNLIVTPEHELRVKKPYSKKPKNTFDKVEERWERACNCNDNYLSFKLPPIKHSNIDSQEWWIIGRYLADGHLDYRKHTFIVSIGNNKIEEFEKNAEGKIGLKTEKEGCYQINLKGMSKEARDILFKIGCGADKKVLPFEAISLNNDLSKSLLYGYLSGDGHKTKSGRWQITSVSRSLLLGISIVVQRVLNISPSIYPGRNERKSIIQGRKVSCKREWNMSIPVKYSFNHIDNNQNVWKKVKSIEEYRNVDVYNIRVEEDASYTAEGCIVKNCPLQLEVYRRLYKMYSNPGEEVLEPFNGIFSGGKVALEMKRKYYGIELKKEYFNESVKNALRIEKECERGLIKKRT